jgi:hypothetical protein
MIGLQPMCGARGAALATMLVLVVGSPMVAAAQEIPREEYLRHLPLGLPRLVQQNPASADLALWGDPDDPAYRDVAPRDGIDDGRHANLLRLAVRFAPFLVQNTGDFPTDFRVYMENRDSFPLVVDTWETSGEEGVFRGTREVNFSALGGAACDAPPDGSAFQRAPLSTSDSALEDCKLLELMDRFTPGSGSSLSRDETLIRGEPALFDVLYFNFPGDGPGSWKASYRPEYEATPEERRASFPHSFVHPFLVEVAGDPGYELVLQYWFFYPSNDSGMDHEGDWEHMNVVVSPRSMVEGALTAETVRRILDGEIPPTDEAPDPLVIKRVDYYFHRFVMPLDFSSPNVYLPRDEWEREVRARPQERFREHEAWEAARYMAYEDDLERVINTHPFGYIGADNKGINQALEMPGPSNRDPHGTYPFPGRYSDVGPGGSTDQVPSYVDSREFLRDLRAGWEGLGPDFRGEEVLGLADPDRLTLLPDWERLVDLVRTEPEVRWRWGWMVLPLRWGFPATRSPFSGILENFDTGNVAPQGPAYNAGWNVTGASSGFELYEPHTIPSVFPLALQDNFRNDLGFLNLTIPTLFNLPPLDFLSRIAAYPFRLALERRDPVYYPKDGVPFRFVGVSSGVSVQTFADDFNALALNPRQYEQFVASFLAHYIVFADENTEVSGGADFMDTAVGTFFQVPFYVGGKFTSENTVRNTRTAFGTRIEFNNMPDYTYRAELNYWEYAGSVRYSLSDSRVQPFLKGGYGWAWYRLEDVQSGGLPFQTPESKWMGPGSVWPNVWHYGLGIELIPSKRVGELPGGLDLAFRLEFSRYSQELGLDLGQIPLGELEVLFPTLADVPGSERVHRNDFLLGITLSF